MNDTVVEKKGFGTIMKNSFSGIVGGIIFVIIGIVVLIFNLFYKRRESVK